MKRLPTFFGLAIGMVLMCPMLAQNALADQEDPRFDEIYKKAEKAVREDDSKTADFWMARYLGLVFAQEKEKRSYSDLIPLFQQRKNLLGATAFLSSAYSNSFRSFFLVEGPAAMWLGPDGNVHPKKGLIDIHPYIYERGKDSFFAVIKMRPVLETWANLKGLKSDEPKVVVVPLGASDPPPLLVTGLFEGEEPKYFEAMSLDIGDSGIQWIWPVKFEDLDGDEVPEVWVRYNLALGSGFIQRLDVYKIEKSARLKLIKSFTGAAEGIARRTGVKTVQTGEGCPGDPGEGHLYYTQHCMTDWEYKDGKFVKTKEYTLPHLLLSDDWEDYL